MVGFYHPVHHWLQNLSFKRVLKKKNKSHFALQSAEQEPESAFLVPLLPTLRVSALLCCIGDDNTAPSVLETWLPKPLVEYQQVLTHELSLSGFVPPLL